MRKIIGILCILIKKIILLKVIDKDMWDIINQNESGHLENKKNIYYYDTVYPLSYIREKKDNNFSQDIGYTYWKSIISYTSDEFSFMKTLIKMFFWNWLYIQHNNSIMLYYNSLYNI